MIPQFIFGGNTGVTPESLARRRAIAEALLARGVSGTPQNVWEGLNAVGDAIVGRVNLGRIDRQEAQGRAGATDAFNELVQSLSPTMGLTGTYDPPAPMVDLGGGIGSDATAADRGASPYRDIIAAIESQGSGDYAALGPRTRTGDRAYGRYQVMGENVGPWTEQALGRRMTPDQYVADPAAQDAVFDEIFGGLVKQHGPQGAARAWFTGSPTGEGSDVLGTSGDEYVQRFNAELSDTGVSIPQRGLDPRMMELAGNPWLSEGRRGIINELLKRQMAEMFPEEEEPTAEMRNWQFGQDNPQFAADQLQLRRASGTTVNVGSNGIDYGDPPTDMQWVRNPDDTVKLDERGVPMALPVQGTKLWAEQEAAKNKDDTANENAARTNDIVLQDIDRSISQITEHPFLTTGIGGQLSSGIGGTPAANVKALIDTIGANVSFDKLQAMRAASPTGGALGSITERELALLESTLGALAQSQDDKQLIDNLKRLKNVYLDVVHGEGKGPQRETLSFNSDLPEGVTEEDVEQTMKEMGMTREQVLQKYRELYGP